MLVVVLWASPVAVFVTATHGAKAEQKRSVEGPSPSVVTVGSRQPQQRQPVDVILDEGPESELRSQLSGTVTGITFAPTQVIGSGAELFSVDGHPVFAMSGGVPLHRDLGDGAFGADVQALQAFLADRGLLSRDMTDGRFGPRVAAGVKSFQRAAGYDPDGVFRRSYVLFVPPGFGAIDSVRLVLGDVLAADRVVAVGSRPVLSARLVRSGSQQEPAVQSGAESTLDVGDGSLALPTLAVGADQLAPLRDLLVAGVRSGSLNPPVSEGESPRTTTYSGAALVSSVGEARGTVPSSAVLLGPDGTRCVFASGSTRGWAERGSRVERLVFADADPTELGVTLVDGALRSRVVARDAGSLPREVRARCAS
ncbi:peptidoglycan-binding domain-containing protein [Leifsonia sp. 21MFCrub1.1]|uniref:peptidoglycan-binding domain-containing protein n=1 Tax=Leifsonia sp. 21MFCrub1.1 TaxID=1798223 RepID=UPI0012FE41B3|nr:peptidoglycan-binding domain-containing protein [Leifsonia sp. 21MFCrub1.1]